MTDSPRDLESSSRTSSAVVIVRKEHFESMVHDTSCYWVYARFSHRSNSVTTQSLYALDMKENVYVPNEQLLGDCGFILGL